MIRLQHHVRFTLAIGLEFQQDNHLQTASFALVNWAVTLPGLLAYLLAAILLWLNALPVRISGLRRRFALPADLAADLALMAEAAWLLLIGRWVFWGPI
ncbi:MAG: hypothetical protein BroJett011_62900 [Chloroflexota bacterium]|nr:MAG: hypothetical protein BroJett011_62900 [Chloroflexota bacterium]